MHNCTVYIVHLSPIPQKNTVCEELDLSDNYIEGDGAEALASMLKGNMFIVNLVSGWSIGGPRTIAIAGFDIPVGRYIILIEGLLRIKGFKS